MVVFVFGTEEDCQGFVSWLETKYPDLEIERDETSDLFPTVKVDFTSEVLTLKELVREFAYAEFGADSYLT